MRRIEVVSYNPSWPILYEQEAACIVDLFGANLLQIHHIGSTAIPAIWAKPIIDIMPIVRNIEAVDDFDPLMIALGYTPRGENTIPGRRFFVKGGDTDRSHHVHTYEKHNNEVARHLDFRDYLRAHPDRAEAYGKLKRVLAGKYPHDIDGYMAGKSAFIRETIQLATAWRERGMK